jgi:hypothetical protein
MSLFDFFKKKDKKENVEPQLQVDESIEILSVDNGSHGDNFGGLIGFGFLNSENGRNLINEYIAICSMQKPVLAKDELGIHQAIFQKEKGINKRLGIRALKAGENVLSAYPYLKTDYTIPFTTKQIFEWSHMGDVEAEIKGGGRDTFGFGFFATDYAVNKNKYKSVKNLNIKVSAIGLVLDKSNVTEIGGQKVSDEFAAYMPNNNIPRPAYYDFIGVLVDFEPVDVSENNAGYIIKVKLINDESNPDFFTVDMFINKENMRIDSLESGMKITGALWFQGEIE